MKKIEREEKMKREFKKILNKELLKMKK